MSLSGRATLVVTAAVAGLVLAGGAAAEKATGPRADKGERELPVPALFGRVSPSVVVIKASGKERAQGSGVVVGAGQVVTNYHVVVGATAVEITQGERRWSATVEAVEPKRDLAILRASFDLPRVTMRPSTALVVGERVYAVGAPRGLELTLSDGLISALRRDKPEKPARSDKSETTATDGGPAVIQTTVPVSPGSSGGGLFDAQGRLIGITTFSATASQNLNFAHPTEWIETLRAPAAGVEAASAVGKAATAPRYTLTQRPKTIRCRIDTRAVWGLFTGGAEMLETRRVSIDVEVRKFQGQTPAFAGGFSGESSYGQLVLADMSRDAGFVQFTGIKGETGAPEYFFSIDDDGRFRVTLLNGFDFHGQLRVRASSGACEPVEIKDTPALADASSEDRCGRGDIDACVAAGAAAEPKNRMSALALFLRGCDQGRENDRVARTAAAARSCGEAARLCDALGHRIRAAELRVRITRLKASAGE